MIASLHREAVADRGLLAVASVTMQKIVLYVRRLAERTGFLLHFVRNCKAEAKQVPMIYYKRANLFFTHLR